VIHWPHDDIDTASPSDVTQRAWPAQHAPAASIRGQQNRSDAVNRLPSPPWPERDAITLRWATALGEGWSSDWEQDAVEGDESTETHMWRLRLELCRHSRLPASWPRIEVDVGGQRTRLCLVPHEQWRELSQPAFALLPDAIRFSIINHLTQGLRQCLGVAAHRLGWCTTDRALPVLAPDAGQAHADPATQQGSEGMAASGPLLQFTATAHGASPMQWTALLDGKQLTTPASVRGTPESAPHLLLPMHLRLGTATLPRADVRGLQVGDVVLLDATPASASAAPVLPRDGGVLVCARQAIAVCEARSTNESATSWHLRHWVEASDPLCNPTTTGRTTLNSDTANPLGANTAAPPDWNQLPVQLEAALIAAPVRVQDATRWVPGAVVPLNVGVDSDRVELRANGHGVARGRLVAVDNWLGLEIIEVYGA
jgi:type III secretion system YscQ/HrcQ family protein